MSLQYLRKAIVVAGDDVNLKIEGLRLVFNVVRSISGYPNTLKLNIYNLNRTTQTRFQKEFTKIILFAGYEDNVKTIFTGNIQNVTIQSNGVDSITSIDAGDADTQFLTSTFAETFAGKSSLEDVVRRIASSFNGVTIGTLSGLDNKFTPLRSATYDGKAAEILTNLGKSYNFDWKINNNVFSTISVASVLDEEAIVVSAKTGLIDVPSITEVGVNVRTLLNPSYVPRGKIQIDTSDSIIQSSIASFTRLPRTQGNGVFPILQVTHIGDTHGTQWLSNLECIFNQDDIGK